jgi:hypothetical protein
MIVVDLIAPRYFLPQSGLKHHDNYLFPGNAKTVEIQEALDD